MEFLRQGHQSWLFRSQESIIAVNPAPGRAFESLIADADAGDVAQSYVVTTRSSDDFHTEALNLISRRHVIYIADDIPAVFLEAIELLDLRWSSSAAATDLRLAARYGSAGRSIHVAASHFSAVIPGDPGMHTSDASWRPWIDAETGSSLPSPVRGEDMPTLRRVATPSESDAAWREEVHVARTNLDRLGPSLLCLLGGDVIVGPVQMGIDGTGPLALLVHLLDGPAHMRVTVGLDITRGVFVPVSPSQLSEQSMASVTSIAVYLGDYVACIEGRTLMSKMMDTGVRVLGTSLEARIAAIRAWQEVHGPIHSPHSHSRYFRSECPRIVERELVDTLLVSDG